MKKSMKNLKLKKVLVVAFSAVLAVSAFAETPLKVAFFHNTPIGNSGWSYQHNIANQAIHKAFGDRVITTYLSDFDTSADVEMAVEDLVKKGYKMIFMTSFDFAKVTAPLAKRFPNIKFENASGIYQDKNLASFTARFYEGRYIAGMLAGAMTKTNKLGFVVAVRTPMLIRGVNATMLGAKSVNPNVKMKVIWMNSWKDEVRENQAVQSLIDEGYDVLMQQTSLNVVQKLGEKNGVWFIGSASDTRNLYPSKVLTNIVYNWTDYYIDRINKVLNNEWESEDTWGGFDNRTLVLTPFNKAIPESIRKQAKKVQESIKNKTFHPFTGPIRTREGKLVLKAGEKISDKGLKTMDYLVEDVEDEVMK